MSMGLILLARVVARRVAAGEHIDAILAAYPRLTIDEREEVGQYVSNN